MVVLKHGTWSTGRQNYYGPLRPTQAAACADLARAQAYASRAEQVKFLGVLQKEAGNGRARGAFGRVG